MMSNSLEETPRNKALNELRAIAFDLYGPMTADAAIAHMVEHHRDLLVQVNLIDKEGKVKLTRLRIYKWCDEFFSSFANRQSAATFVFYSGLQTSMRNMAIMNQRIMDSSGSDTDASREARGWLDAAAKLTGAYAPEKVQNIGVSEAEIVDVDELFLARQQTLEQVSDIPELEEKVGTEEEE